ncbi:MAG: PRC-barrel domain-containing protein [Nanoarchaeota archaeon]
MVEDKRSVKALVGKTIVSKAGKRFGEVGNLSFETRTGELLQLVLKNPTSYCDALDLDRDKNGNLLIPYSAVIAIGDFVVVAEEDIM